MALCRKSKEGNLKVAFTLHPEEYTEAFKNVYRAVYCLHPLGFGGSIVAFIFILAKQGGEFRWE